MSSFIPWNSQPLDVWAEQHAPGRFVELKGRRTHYLVRGDGPPVILVHGFNMDGYTWRENVDSLAAHFRVFVPDLWGLGFSTRTHLDYGYSLFAEQLALFMDAMGLERASLVGHSMGGGTSIVFALAQPERVERVALVDSVGVPEKLPLRAKLFQLPRLPEFLLGLNTNAVRRKNLQDYWVYDNERLTDAVFADFTRFRKIERSTEVLLDILRKQFFNTLPDEIRAFGALGKPTFIFWGRADATVPLSSGETMHRLLPGSRLEVFDAAAHMPNFDHPERFNRQLIDFLAAAA